mgnify:CR=1 FL=1
MKVFVDMTTMGIEHILLQPQSRLFVEFHDQTPTHINIDLIHKKRFAVCSADWSWSQYKPKIWENRPKTRQGTLSAITHYWRYQTTTRKNLHSAQFEIFVTNAKIYRMLSKFGMANFHFLAVLVNNRIIISNIWSE